jgi:hypothetical protein
MKLDGLGAARQLLRRYGERAQRLPAAGGGPGLALQWSGAIRYRPFRRKLQTRPTYVNAARGALSALGSSAHGPRLRHGPAGHDPLDRLAGEMSDEVVIAVVVQHGDVFSFCHCGD